MCRRARESEACENIFLRGPRENKRLGLSGCVAVRGNLRPELSEKYFSSRAAGISDLGCVAVRGILTEKYFSSRAAGICDLGCVAVRGILRLELSEVVAGRGDLLSL